MSLSIDDVRLRRLSTHRTRVFRTDNGKILGYLERVDPPKHVGRVRQPSYLARPAHWAFLGTASDDGEPGDRVPRALLDAVPGIHSSHLAATQALLRHLDTQRAPGVGHPPHPDVDTLAKEIV
jgi:hypothetical protein